MDEKSQTQGERQMARSSELLDRARALIPQAAQTNSKSPSQFVQGVAPSHIECGDGCRVWDVDGNEYIDHVNSLGPIILGHDYPAVSEATHTRIDEGTVFSMPHRLQVEVAEAITEMVPCAEMVRFAKNGHDVTDLAVKVMRGYTGCEVVATQGYHGWTDQWVAGSDASRGLPDIDYRIRSFDYNDIESLEEIFAAHEGEMAGVIMEGAKYTPPEDEFLQQARELCDEHDAVLAFDEILTGFRFAPGGAQEFFGVTPDLACFAKGMANGYPISALAGRADVMRVIEDDSFVYSMTYAGESVSLAAAKATLEVLRSEPVHEHIFEMGELLRDGYNEIAADHGLDDITRAKGYPPMSGISFDDHGDVGERLLESFFMQECFERGVLFSGNQTPNYSVTEADVDETLAAYEGAMTELADALAAGKVADRLRGEPIGASIRERTGTAE